jgi:N-acetylglucosaminyldiphosphoundecaprenol N-acetyl-beta-D-mannosaminyltransferase
MPIKTFNLFGIRLHNVSYLEILDSIQYAIKNHSQLSICYANINSINLAYADESIKTLFSNFDIAHPDGFGVYLSLKILFGKQAPSNRINGSDFYESLIQYGIEHDYNFFFFGDEDITLNQINSNHHKLKIVGTQNGYEFDSPSLISRINKSSPDILIVGLGTPKQEAWIVQNKQELKVNVIISVGDGIKVFSGTKKRGPKFLQIIGLEWLVRLFFDPKRLWKRYFIGIPLFIFRVLKFKFMNTKTG